MLRHGPSLPIQDAARACIGLGNLSYTHSDPLALKGNRKFQSGGNRGVGVLVAEYHDAFCPKVQPGVTHTLRRVVLLPNSENGLAADYLPLNLAEQLVHPLLSGAVEREDASSCIRVQVE
jgi:hypothetical protein